MSFVQILHERFHETVFGSFVHILHERFQDTILGSVSFVEKKSWEMARILANRQAPAPPDTEREMLHKILTQTVFPLRTPRTSARDFDRIGKKKIQTNFESTSNLDYTAILHIFEPNHCPPSIFLLVGEHFFFRSTNISPFSPAEL